MFQVWEVNDVAELGRYRSAWESLLAQTTDATFFQSLDWLEVYWEHSGGDQRLRVLVVAEGNEPTGILPLVVRTERTRIGSLRFLTYPLDYWGSFYGPIGPFPDKTLKAGLRYLRRRRRDWDVLELRWLPDDDTDPSRTGAILKSLGLRPCRTLVDQTAVIRLEGTWEDYLAKRTSKWRNNYRRWQRRLQEQGRLDYLRYRPRGAAHGDGDPRWDLYDACIEVAQKSWQGSSRDGTTLSHDSVSSFLKDVHAAAARVGALDLNLLLLDGAPFAFIYNYHYRGHLFGLRVGHDKARARDGAGNLLYARTIEDSFRRGDRLYDLGPGSLDCKRYFQTEIRPIFRCSHFPRLTVRPQLLRLKRCIDAMRQASEPALS